MSVSNLDYNMLLRHYFLKQKCSILSTSVIIPVRQVFINYPFLFYTRNVSFVTMRTITLCGRNWQNMDILASFKMTNVNQKNCLRSSIVSVS